MASRHRFQLNGRVRAVTVEESNGALRVSVDDGEPLTVDATTSGVPGIVSMIVDGRPSKAIVSRVGRGYAVTVGGRRFILEPAIGSGKGRSTNGASATPGVISAPSSGTVIDVRVAVGDHISAGDTVVVIEAMKMQNELQTLLDGTVTAVSCETGARVEQGDVLVEYDVSEDVAEQATEPA